jgi:hypothetical protein
VTWGAGQSIVSILEIRGMRYVLEGRVENVGRCLAKRMESHKLICESFSLVFRCMYIAAVVRCSVVSALPYV